MKNYSLCSCIICHKIYNSKGIHSHYLMNHGTDEEQEKMKRCNKKQSNSRHFTNKNKANLRKLEYNNCPSLCFQCKLELPYEKRRNKFCSSSCAATYNNLNSDPNRKFGPIKKNKMVVSKTKKLQKIKIVKPKRIKSEKINHKECIIGPYTRIYFLKCHHCEEIFTSRKISRYCTSHHDFYKNNRNRFQFTFNIYEYPDLFDLTLIDKYGWYSPGNRGPKNNNGISRDHKISIRDAIKNNYDPYYISHPLNCELMSHSKNKEKYVKSSISYEELILAVDMYDMVEGSGHDPQSVLTDPTA